MAEPAKPGALKRQNTTSRRAQLDEKGEEIVKSGCFTKCVMKCPCVVMWVTFLVSLILSALPIVDGAITIDPVNFAGFDIPNDPNMIGFALWNNYDLVRAGPPAVGYDRPWAPLDAQYTFQAAR